MDKKLAENGLAVRREVLGAAYVDKAMQSADDFNREFMDIVNEYCWGLAWTRPGLSRKTRSMLNLAMLSVLGRAHEFKLHVRGALNNGLTKDEIKEVLVQVTVYAGIPAGVEAFRLAREVFAEEAK